MKIVTHEYADTLSKFKDVPALRFENLLFQKHLETSGRQTLLGKVINRIYVNSLEFPQTLNKEHWCLFIVDVPYYSVFERIYQERFAPMPTGFDKLSNENIVSWIMDTYNIKTRRAKKLLDYFRGNLLKMLHNPDAVNRFLTEKVNEPYFQSYTYETIYKFLTGNMSVTKDDYLKALYRYRESRTAVTTWLRKKLVKEGQDQTLEGMRLLLWLQDKVDTDLLIFAKEAIYE